MKVTVIGGGASGLMAAIISSWNGVEVRLIEKEGKLAKKLLASSNGRGNFSNFNYDESHYFSNDISFVRKIIQRFGIVQTLSVFEELGVMSKQIDSKLFPYTEKAKDIVTLFLYELKKNNVKIITNYEIKDIMKENDKFVLKSINKAFESDRVIVATGGLSSPQYGSHGNMLNILESLGHSIIKPVPGLVPLKIKGLSKETFGAKLTGAAVLIDETHQEISPRYFGEVLFKDDAFNGIPVLEISNYVHNYFEEKRQIFIKIDPFLNFSLKELLDILLKKMETRPEKPLRLLLTSMIDERLIPFFFQRLGYDDLDIPIKSLKINDYETITYQLKNWLFEIIGTEDWEKSQVTLGGINTKEIDTTTLESKIVPGMYFAGEIMDVAGESGGYNLQWAWSTGYISGDSASIS